MPYYARLKDGTGESRRTAEGLLRLKSALTTEIPARTAGDSLLLGTWNLREFESGKYGPRTMEPIYYIAEIISRFDLVAVQEVRDDLSSFNKLVGLLGGGWNYVLSDVTEGSAGNRERMAFLYDSRKISFTGLAGEIVLPPSRTGDAEQVARTPYLVAFQAGWLKFALCTVHIYYGKSTAEDPRRVREIKRVAGFIADRADSEHPDSANTVLLGDFNIFATTDATMNGITSAGFTIPDQVLALNTDLGGKHHYDQIAILGNDIEQPASLKAGTFKFFEHVYRDDDMSLYRTAMGPALRKKNNGKTRTEAERRSYYRAWRTFQVSDHQPLWVELPIDLSAPYLEKIAAAPARSRAAKKASAGTESTSKSARTSTGRMSTKRAQLDEPAQLLL